MDFCASSALGHGDLLSSVEEMRLFHLIKTNFFLCGSGVVPQCSIAARGKKKKMLAALSAAKNKNKIKKKKSGCILELHRQLAQVGQDLRTDGGGTGGDHIIRPASPAPQEASTPSVQQSAMAATVARKLSPRKRLSALLRFFFFFFFFFWVVWCGLL